MLISHVPTNQSTNHLISQINDLPRLLNNHKPIGVSGQFNSCYIERNQIQLLKLELKYHNLVSQTDMTAGLGFSSMRHTQSLDQLTGP